MKYWIILAIVIFITSCQSNNNLIWEYQLKEILENAQDSIKTERGGDAN